MDEQIRAQGRGLRSKDPSGWSTWGAEVKNHCHCEPRGLQWGEWSVAWGSRVSPPFPSLPRSFIFVYTRLY